MGVVAGGECGVKGRLSLPMWVWWAAEKRETVREWEAWETEKKPVGGKPAGKRG